MYHPGSRFRIRFLRDLFRIFIFPSLLLTAFFLLSETHFKLSFFRFLLYPAVISFAACLRTLYDDHLQAADARRLGARPIPRVKGKWPGNVDIMLKMMKDRRSEYIQDVFLELFKEYKSTTLNLRILWTDKIVTMDREHMKYVFSTGFKEFWRGDAQKERLETFLGNGIFNRDDEVWKMHRALARPFFARDRISDFDIFEKNTQRVLSLLSAPNKPWDAQDLYARFTLDAASEFLFGQNLDTLSYNREDVNSFGRAFSGIQSVIVKRGVMGSVWPLFEMFNDQTTKHARIIRDWLDPVMKRVLDHQQRQKEPVEKSTFLEYLADNIDDVDFIRDQLLNILLASRDTTSSLLTFSTYFLAIQPEITAKLRTEVLKHLGKNGIPTIHSIKDLKYMRAFLMESLRIFHPVPSNSRESRPHPTILPPSDPTFSPSANENELPLYMPPSTTVLVLPFLMQRNPALWGDDAEDFDPERWIDPERMQRFLNSPMMFTPFSAGPRICLGQNYALNEASFFLIRLLQQYDSFTLVEDRLLTPPWLRAESTNENKNANIGSKRKDRERIWPGYALTLFVKGGLWVKYGKAED